MSPVLPFPASNEPNNITPPTPSISYEAACETEQVKQPKANIIPVQDGPPSPWAMPLDAGYGELLRRALATDSPLEFAYPAILALIAGQGVKVLQPSVQGEKINPCLYTSLCGGPGVGKSRTIARAVKVLGLDRTDGSHRKLLVKSDRGLVTAIGDAIKRGEMLPHTSTALIVDEGGALLRAMSYSGSTLPQILCDMWSEPIYEMSVKDKLFGTNTTLSLLFNLPVTDASGFAKEMGLFASGGFHDRLSICPGPESFVFDDQWEPPMTDRIKLRPTSIDSAGYAFIREYKERRRAEGRPVTRLMEIAIRVAVISTAANNEVNIGPDGIDTGTSIVTRAALAAGIKYMEWQERIRVAYCAGEAENEAARMTTEILEGIRHALAEHEAGRPVFNGKNEVTFPNRMIKWWPLVTKKNWLRKFGSGPLKYALDALVAMNFLVAERDDEKQLTHRYYFQEGV